jgi:hypothetical protein
MVPSCSISSEPPLLANSADAAQLPPLVAAAILMTADYAAPPGGAVEGSPHVAGWLPETLRCFGSRRWCGDWTGDRANIWLTPMEGERVRYAPPPGYVEMVDAIGTLASELRGMIRKAVLSEAFIAGQATGEADGAEVITDYGGRFRELLMEVLIGLREEMDTAHGRLDLLSEVRGRSVHAAAHTATYPRFAGGTIRRCG